MGGCLSSNSSSSTASSSTNGSGDSSSSSSSSSSSRFKNMVRLVHLNGSVEVFEFPIIVAQVTGKQPKHFLFAQAQLLTIESKPMDSQAQLQVGNIYFLLPHSLFQSELSPIDLANISKRLTVAALQVPPPPSTTTSPDPRRHHHHSSSADNSIIRRQQNPSSSPNRFAGRYSSNSYSYNNNKDNIIGTTQKVACVESAACWKPSLESIKERSSFSLRTESDLQDHFYTTTTTQM